MATINLGKITSYLLLLVLVIFGFLAVNPAVLQSIIGDNLYFRYGAFIIALLVTFGNYYYPRLKVMVLGGEPITIDHGKLSTFLATALGLFASVGILYPDAIVSLLGSMGLSSYATTIVYVLGAFYNYQFPRNAQYQLPAETPETPADPPEISSDDPTPEDQQLPDEATMKQ